MSDRIPVLDSLRGMAILSVFSYHAFFWSGVLVDGWLSRAVMTLTRPAWLGVDLFFVLSGFLITGRLLDRRREILPTTTTSGSTPDARSESCRSTSRCWSWSAR